MIAIKPAPADLINPSLKVEALTLGPIRAEGGPERLIKHRDNFFRLHILEYVGDECPCVVLPLDRLFEIRTAAALRLWRSLSGRSSGRNPAELPAARRERLILALRAFDGRLDKASYRDIAEVLFSTDRMLGRDWKTHDLRDRTIRLVRLGV